MLFKMVSTRMGILALVGFGLLLAGCSDKPKAAKATEPVATSTATAAKSTAPATDKTFRVLTIISYNSGLPCTDLQVEGFREALRGVNVEYKLYEMDAKHKNSKDALAKAGQEACDLIESWKPDLVHVADDAAQVQVTTKYLNTSLPFVFSGVNEDPEKYGFEKASNVTGCLEREHFTATIRLLQQMAPKVKRIGVLLDEEPFWNTVVARMKKEAAEMPDVQFVSWGTPKTFAEFKDLMHRYEQEVDAVAVIGVFAFKDESGKNVNYQVVQQWIAENLKIPDCSFWYDRVTSGTLCSMTVAARQQGMVAGEMAKQILLEGKHPSDLPMRPTYKGEPCINLPRARVLGLNPSAEVLLSSRVFQEYDWKK